ncbi:metallophosphoesterase family protein [Brevibacillus sp. BC25]|uniref:metallophosphoesterase family protein n=1 Tax=Brevibacillus sp. BC25 TaxID=1144308 RepID=UPI000271294C|nr:metallophosphoesterase family protein [Brevibacillus sp. BC25]EJL26173.1 putative phosphohydrolase [Brevibacillus sp. BC25]
MKRKLIIGDIHGYFHILKQLLEKINYKPIQDQVIFIGDYISRGPESLKVVSEIKRMVEEEDAIALMGNHEYSLIEFLDSRNPSFDLFFLHKMGGMNAIESFLQGVDDSVFNDIELVKRTLKVERKEEIDFINHLPYYFEDEGHIFVHAGVRPRNWRETTPSDFVWIGEDFIESPTGIDKVVIFGHTPTSRIKSNPEPNQIWYSTEGDKIGIDGGCGYSGGQLNALEINTEGYRNHFVKC